MAILKLTILASTILSSALASSVSRATVAAKKSSGCGINYADLTQPIQYLDTGGKNRSYYIHLPPTYDSNHAYPMVVGFHGSQSIGLFLAFDSKMNETRFSGDKIMVYPNGEGGSWAGPSYHNGSSVEEDINFVADVIKDVQGKYCVDEERTFGVGMSNGGGFIGTLACDPKGSSLFTGLASHSGAFYTDNNGPSNGCAPSKMVPLIEIHGASDTVVSYFGGKGEGGQLPAVPFWMDWWGARNKCGNKTETWLFNNEVMHATWTCDGKEGLLQHYVVVSMGHCWADTEPNFSQATVPQGPTVIQASKIVMEFFDSVLPN